MSRSLVDAPATLDASSITAFADASPEMTAEDIGREMAATATESQLRALAEAHIALLVDRVRRDRAREAEHQACLAVQTENTAARYQEEAEQRERDYQALFADPELFLSRREQRAEFRTWAGERFGEWYERGHAAAAAKGDSALVLFESDWHPDGPSAYYRERHRRQVWELIEAKSRSVRLRATRELLATVFALGDGTETTWGAATVAQHVQRIEMLTTNAAGIVETAARHRAAVRMIEDAGVKCLAELTDPSA